MADGLAIRKKLSRTIEGTVTVNDYGRNWIVKSVKILPWEEGVEEGHEPWKRREEKKGDWYEGAGECLDQRP